MFPTMTIQKKEVTTTGKFTTIVFDYDLFCYDIGWAAEQGEGKEPLSFSWVKEVIDTRIWEIRQTLGCGKYHGYLTGKGNFREELAERDVYKGNRKAQKPHWYEAIRTYLINQHHAEVIDGMEADDALAIYITKEPTAICVSRDKDLRQVQGWHYGYSVGKQPEYGPILVDELGELILTTDGIKGTGLKFFYSQIITGDTVDNYKGLPGAGPVAAYNTLYDAVSNEDCYQRVLALYEEKYAENAVQELLEQARLAWMVRELDEDGNPIMWEPPK